MVVQEDFAGCAVACVAELLGISYKEALEYFDHPENAARYGFYCREIVVALQNAGLKAELRYVKPHVLPKLTRPGTIVFTRKGDRYLWGHYFLRTKEGWMNPWINYPLVNPARAGVEQELPGQPQFAIFTAN